MALADSPGFYVAHHPWLDREFGAGALWKVGFSASLGARLSDGAYTTCYPRGWRYHWTCETATADEALAIETAVLAALEARRLDGRELVRAGLSEIIDVAAAAAAAMGQCGGTATFRRDPVYTPGLRQCSASVADELADAVRLMSIGATEATATAATTATTAATSLDAELDELFGGGWELSAAEPVDEPPAHSIAEAVTAAYLGAAAAGAAEDADGDADALLDDLDGGDSGAPSHPPIEERAYQETMAADAWAGLCADGRGIAQVACRCGKTLIAYKVAQKAAAARAEAGRPPGPVLILVPSLKLLEQTAQKLAHYGAVSPLICVGSRLDEFCLAPGRTARMSTDPATVAQQITAAPACWVISTYQSSPVLPDADWSLVVYDECHRTCGGAEPRPFNHTLLRLRNCAAAPPQLFMTATPAKEARLALNMGNRELYGGVVCRYYLRQGIAAGYVNDFRLELVVGDLAPDALPRQIVQAMGVVDKLLVFCRDIRQACTLADAVAAAATAAATAATAATFECLVAHSRAPAWAAATALRRFAQPGVRAALFNCRLFQEGVEIPALNGVFFAAPRHSPRDIIQSLCRPLNRAADKPPSVVFLPVTRDPAVAADAPANLQRFASIVPFVDALLDEDPALFEHLLDPKQPYPLGVTGATASAAAGIAAAAVLAAARRAVRFSGAAWQTERLLRSERVPWDRALAEIRRIVEVCGRYPKTTDSWRVGDATVCLHRFYRRAADAAAAAARGEPCALEPHQLHDLASLPGWDPYGLEGPYPWRRCMEFLEDWLERNGGVPPPVEINKGGYVGLEATMMERLSGALTCINQQVFGKKVGGVVTRADRVAPAQRADLDRICQRFGLRWQKVFREDGTVDPAHPTFIQEAYTRFKLILRAEGAGAEYIQRWFPGYPGKHARQERPDVIEAKLAPPRVRRAGPRRRLPLLPK